MKECFFFSREEYITLQHQNYLYCWYLQDTGVLHTGPWIQIRFRSGIPDLKTTVPPHGRDPDRSCVLCCATVHQNSAWDPAQQCIRPVCAPCGAHARQHWIRIRDSNPVNPISVPVRRAPLLHFICVNDIIKTCFDWLVHWLIDEFIDNIIDKGVTKFILLQCSASKIQN